MKPKFGGQCEKYWARNFFFLYRVEIGQQTAAAAAAENGKKLVWKENNWDPSIFVSVFFMYLAQLLTMIWYGYFFYYK